MDDLKRKIAELEKKVKDLIASLDLEKKRGEIAFLERKMAGPDFWQDQVGAKKTAKEAAVLRQEVEKIEKWKKTLEEAKIMVDLIKKEKNAVARKEAKVLEKELERTGKEVGEFELAVFLSGPYDRHEAIVSIHAGEGGTEAMDWTAMLFRMYTRFLEKKGWPHEVIDQTPGEEAGIKSVTLAVRGDLAYGFLKGEAGTHRLVRLSPFDADNLRHTSFAQVEVLPQIGEKEVELNPDELEFAAFRASGHGGQNVNKVSTAVRLRHRPSGISVTCQSERSQHQNRLLAEELLRAKLWQRKEVEMKEKKQKLKGDYKPASWGHQIRSYVLHPYHLVKDLRTGHETTDTSAVLDGQIDEFIEAELKEEVGN